MNQTPSGIGLAMYPEKIWADLLPSVHLMDLVLVDQGHCQEMEFLGMKMVLVLIGAEVCHQMELMALHL